ncbi:COG1399 Predicted metal-binding, possibly nucleic acid-binding protein [Candidatus Nanopelagicaceae bacterium]
MSKQQDSFQLNTFELPRRAGEMKEYQLDIPVKENFGVPLISVPAGEVIEVDVRLESVTEGVLLSADVYAVAKGECIRCLDPVEIVIERKIQELYNYEPTNERGKKKKRDVDEIDLDLEDELMMDGNIMDLETPIRDAVVLSLPINPLCDEECLGLCPECGGKWADLPEDHAHEVIDARWASLGSLTLDDPDFKI